MSKIYLLATALAVSNLYSYAQSDSTKSQNLEQVVVTGQYQAQSVKNSVYQVRVISKERIIKQGATRIEDLLRNELNVRFSQDLATGGSNMEVLGLSGQNIKILIDGIPVVGRQGTSNEIDVNQVNINSIEKIEIIEGPVSVIYGADALAGVINIITKKPAKENLSVKARLHEETAGKEYGFKKGTHNQYAEVGWGKNKWKLGGSIGRNYFGGWKGSALGRELEWHKKEQVLGNIFAGYYHKKGNIHYRLDMLDETITNPGAFSGNEAIDQNYLSTRIMQQLQSSYAVNSNLSFQNIFSYSNYKRELFSTAVKTNGETTIARGAGMQDVTRFNGFTARGTSFYKISSAISIQPGYDVNIENGEGERLKEGVQQVSDYALFISSEIIPVRGVKLRPGARFTKNSVYDAPPVIPSFNTMFTLSPKVNLRAAFARGFRTPSLRELYFYFFDANHQIIGNTSLKSETSNSITASVDWAPVKKKDISLTVSATGFYNDVDNLISVGQSASNATLFTYINVEKYKTRGISILNQLSAKNISASLGAAYTGRYNEYSEQDISLPSFKWSAEVNSNISYQFPKSGISLNIYYKYTGKLPSFQLVNIDNRQEVQLTETAGYHWADIALNKKLSKLLTVNTGVKNLFNITRINNTAVGGSAHSESGPRPVGYGRSFFAGLFFEWNTK